MFAVVSGWTVVQYTSGDARAECLKLHGDLSCSLLTRRKNPASGDARRDDWACIDGLGLFFFKPSNTFHMGSMWKHINNTGGFERIPLLVNQNVGIARQR
jgi:hypothetical protein